MTKINTIFKFKTYVLIVAVSILVLLQFSVVAQTVNQGYNSDEPLQKGMIVVIKDNDANKVDKATSESIEKIKGVVVQQNDSPVTLSSSGQNVFVATTGIYETLVSDENGSIKAGDYISISSLAGIGMKAKDDQKIVVGRAAADFDGQQGKVGSSEDPKTKAKINFARIKVSVGVSQNPWLRENFGNAVPRFVQKLSISIAGKPVNTTRIWMATAVFLGTALIVGVMLYSGARSSLLSVGRNPLSKSAIIRGLGQVVVLSLIVFVSGMFAVYLLLKI
jgi:hypothetical protein